MRHDLTSMLEGSFGGSACAFTDLIGGMPEV